MVKAAIVGHSQVPVHISVPDVETHVFRKPGAKLHHFHDTLLSDVLEFSPDIVVLILEGKDIDGRDDCAQRVASGLKDIIEILKTHCPQVVFVEIEWRDFDRSPIPNLTRETYNARRLTINRNLKRFCRNRNNHYIITAALI